MKTTMSNILDLNALYPKIKDKKFSIKTSYKFSKLFKAVSGEYDYYTNEVRNIVNRYAERDEDGNPISTKDGTGVQIARESVSIAQKELNELLSIEVEIPDITFTIEELDSSELTVEDFNYLLPFVEE